MSFRRIGKERTDEGLVLTVFCPKQTAVVPISDCRSCGHCKGLSLDTSEGDSFLRCDYRGAVPDLTPSLNAEGADRIEPSVGDLMTTPVRCVTKDMSAESLLRIFVEDGISAVPVVNGEGRPIGVVSKSDLLREQFRGGLPDDLALWSTAAHQEPVTVEALDEFLAGRSVAELMTPFAFSLPVDAPVSLAAALMSYEAVHRIAVTESDGMVVGILSSLDVMRWLARSSGYTIPLRTRRTRV